MSGRGWMTTDTSPGVLSKCRPSSSRKTSSESSTAAASSAWSDSCRAENESEWDSTQDTAAYPRTDGSHGRVAAGAVGGSGGAQRRGPPARQAVSDPAGARGPRARLLPGPARRAVGPGHGAAGLPAAAALRSRHLHLAPGADRVVAADRAAV